LALLLAVGLCGTAGAATVLRLENVTTGVGVVVADNGVGDADPTVGAVTFIGGIAGFTINVSTAVTEPVPGYRATLHLNSVNVQTVGAGTLRICTGETGYGFPEDGLAQLHGEVAGVLTPALPGSSATFQSWADPGNLLPAYGPATGVVGALLPLGPVPAGSVPAWTPSAVTFGPGVFVSEDSSYFFKNGPYSLFTQADLVFTGRGTVSFDEVQLVTSAPEPTTLLLLGGGALPLIRRLRRKA
jgi:hypothetical protein